MFDKCVFSRCQSGFQRRPFRHTWREGGQCEPKDPNNWHGHRPVHLRICTKDKKRKDQNVWQESTELLSKSSYRWFHELLILERQRDPDVDFWGKVRWKLLLLCQRSAWMLVEEKALSYWIYSALWRTCLMSCVLRDLWSSFSCPLSGLTSCVLPLKSKSWSRVLSFCARLSLSRFLVGRQPLALGLLFASASTPSLIKAKVAAFRHLNVRTVQTVVLLSSTNEVGPKTQSANMNVFLPCSVCFSLVLG